MQENIKSQALVSLTDLNESKDKSTRMQSVTAAESQDTTCQIEWFQRQV